MGAELIAVDSLGIRLVPDNLKKLKINVPAPKSGEKTTKQDGASDRHPHDASQGSSPLPDSVPYYFATLNDGSLLWPAEHSPTSMIALEGTGAVENRLTSGAVVDLIRVALGDDNREAFEAAHAEKWFAMKHGRGPRNEFELRDFKSNFSPLFEQALERARGIKRISVNGLMGKIGSYDFDQKRLYLGATPSYKLHLFKDDASFDGVFINMEGEQARSLVSKSHRSIFIATGSIYSLRQTPVAAAAAAAFLGDHIGLKIEDFRIVVMGSDNRGKVVKIGEFPSNRIGYKGQSH